MRLYLHIGAIQDAEDGLRARIAAAESLAGLVRGEGYNLVRVGRSDQTVALLHYPALFDDAFPALAASTLVDLGAGTVSYRTYAHSLNPPILHRKELLLPEDDPRREIYAALTAACESIGLFDDPRRIGYRRQWDQLVRERGYRIVGHSLEPLGNDDGGSGELETGADRDNGLDGWQAARHRTALNRFGFSAPIQCLSRHGFLDGRYGLFDYGCGHGDDVRGLRENNLTASGWDPYFAPDEPVQSADLVNLGFVINVIEDFDERLEALTRAWSLASTLLVVSVMLANQNDARGERFRDGVKTQRGTFQKYYTQTEIKAFIEGALDVEAIPVAPGVHYVFRDKDVEQRFFVDRYRSRLNRLRVPSARERPSEEKQRRDRGTERYRAHQSELDALWGLWLGLGRRPDESEVDDALTLTEGFGSVGKALRFLEVHKAKERGEAEVVTDLAKAEVDRVEDLRVYFALEQFERRKPYKHLEPRLKRDIRQFFGDYRAAQSAGWELLLQIADVAAVEKACREAVEHGLGWLATDDVGDTDGDAKMGESEGGSRAVSLQLDARLVEQLPGLLRVYVGAASAAYGDYRNADLVKIHIGSGKLTLMRFDDFDDAPLPQMLERVKIKLREQDVEVYRYGEDYEPPYLYWKSRYINEEHPRYPEQLAFDEALDALGLFDLSGYGPSPGDFRQTLARHRWEIDDFALVRSKIIPNLNDACGRFLTFRDLIECGETQAQTGLANLPKRAESWNALVDLAEQVLDPVIDWFGMVRLTYGFCSPELSRKIHGRIDPKLDQHASCEQNRLGSLICARQGAAADFIVADENMLEVAQWVVANTPFDRLYFYGPDLPIHVSYGPDNSRQIVQMMKGSQGRLLPRVITTISVVSLDCADKGAEELPKLSENIFLIL